VALWVENIERWKVAIFEHMVANQRTLWVLENKISIFLLNSSKMLYLFNRLDFMGRGRTLDSCPAKMLLGFSLCTLHIT